jgi:hypothetical protein
VFDEHFSRGVDCYSSKNRQCRRQWLEDKLHATGSAFAIKFCAYAVLVLKIGGKNDPAQ